MKIGDRFIILLIVISLALGIVINKLTNTSNTKYILIMADGQVYQKIPLVPELRDSKFIVKSKEGYMYVEIKDGKVRVIDSTCPDKLCIKQGWISNVGETIVCLPNRITISIIGGNSSVDSVSY